MRHEFPAALPRIRATKYAFALAALSILLLSPRVTQAQLGRLKKMGADAIRDAAKDKLGTDKKDAATDAAKASSMPVLDDTRIGLVLASLAPQVKAAQIRADAAAASRAYQERAKTSEACIERATEAVTPMAIAASAKANAARLTALQNQTESMQRRLEKATQSNDIRARFYLQDSVTVIMQRSAILSIGASCTFDFAPPAVIEEQILEAQDAATDDADKALPDERVRGALSRFEYGILRERIALWALLQDTPALKGLGKEGVFSADEQAALTSHAAEIRKLTPLFKSNAMIWKGWDDLRNW
jgi:hypothetical protein